MRVYSRYFACWRVLPFWVAILLLCSSCTKDEPVYEDVAIGFGARMSGNAEQQGTKLQPDATVFDTDDKMGVYGYLVHNGTYGTDGDVAYSAPYITNGVIEYDAAESQSTGRSLWHFNPARYWPNMGYEAMNFYAYWPYVASSPPADSPGLTVNEQEGSYPYFLYKTDVAGGASKEDFLVAQASGWREIVDLYFKRPLAKVVWKVRNKDWIGINGVDILMQIYDEANFQYTESPSMDNWVDEGDGWFYFDGDVKKDWYEVTTDENDKETVTYNCVGEKKDMTLSYNVMINGDATDNTEPTEVGCCYLIPQQIIEFAIVYNYHKEKVTLSNEPINLQAGHQYTVTLVISKDYVIEVETSEGEDKWYTVTNDNNLIPKQE